MNRVLLSSIILGICTAGCFSSEGRPEARSDAPPPPPPRNWGVALFPSFDSIDVFGPLNPLFYLAFSRQLNLALISDTLDPVWVAPVSEQLNAQNSSFWFSVNPTHTYSSAPEDIEVLLVPGGPGVTLGNTTSAVDYVRRVYPKLRYLITTCTGAGIAAQAGVLDGRRATTNKSAWANITAMGPDVHWVSPARWVVDGNIWSASGVTAGLDLIFSFIDQIYGPDLGRAIQGVVEYVRANDSCDDPFGEWFDVPPSGQC